MLASKVSRAFTARPCRASTSSRTSSVRCAATRPDAPHGASVTRRLLVGGGLLSAGAAASPAKADEDKRIGTTYVHTEEEWKQLLTPKQYDLLRGSGTELPGSSPLNFEKRKGKFVCAGCGTPLFPSDTKYESGTGWPSFYASYDGALEETMDYSILFMPRVEMRCKACGGHIGHVFEDGPRPTGRRFCSNGGALNFIPDDAAAGQV